MSGEEIRKLRKEKGLTLKELAEITGLDDSTISKVETGTRNPQKTTLKIIVEALENAKCKGTNKELVENILCEFIYLDCNKEINYKNMTGEQVVEEYDKVIKRLLDRYNISLDDYYVRSEDYE